MSEDKKLTKSGNQNDEVILDFDAALISPDHLKKAVSSFVDLLKAVTEAAAEGGKKVQWDMSVRKGSCIVAAKPVKDTESSASAKRVMQAIPDGLRLLDKGISVMPDYFNDKALRAARDLASLQGPKGLKYVRIKGSGKKLELGSASIASIDRILGGQHQSIGTVEGRLQTLTERGQLQFVVYDSLYDKGVNCFMTDEISQTAIEAFRRRVAVSGIIQYDQHCRPVSIKVDAIRIFKEDSELPPIRELRGILKR